MTSIRIVWISLACVLALPANLVAGTVFTLIDDTSGRLTSLGLFPSINGAGTVGFNGSPGLGTAGVYVGSGGAVSTIAEFQGPNFSINSVSPPTINGAGTGAFELNARTFSGTNESVYAGSGGPLTTIADTTSGTFQHFFGIPSINLAGTVAFGAILSNGSEGIFTGQGGPLTTVATTGTMFSSFQNNGGPSLNNAGTVAFTADRGGGLGLGVFASQGGNLITIAQNAPGLTVVEGRPGINNGGMVTFLAFTQVNGQATEGIFTGIGGAPTLLATGNFSGTPAINDSGTVAYNKILSGGAEALFTQAGPGAPANEIIATGDSLFGSTVTLLGLSTFGLNNDGQLAFGAELADGRTVIVRADIGVVPEPSSFMMWLFSLGVLGSVGLSRALSGHVKQDRCRRPLPPS
jgi:hypothetical protein